MADDTTTDSETETEAVVSAADVALVAGEAADTLRRAWLDAILPLAKYYPPAEATVSEDVQQSVDLLVCAVCARLKRIMRSDIVA